MIIEGFGAIAAGITILHSGSGAYSWFTGNTLTSRLDEIADEVSDLKMLTESIGYSAKVEVRRRDGQSATPSGLQEFITPMKRVQNGFGVDLLQSKLVRAPEHLMRNFGENPERILSNIVPLHQFDITEIKQSNPNLVPVVFDRWGVDFIGWIMTGYLDLLNIDYKPVLEREIKFLPASANKVRSPIPSHTENYELRFNPVSNWVSSICLHCGRNYSIEVSKGNNATYKCPIPCGKKIRISVSHRGQASLI